MAGPGGKGKVERNGKCGADCGEGESLEKGLRVQNLVGGRERLREGYLDMLRLIC